MTADTNKVPTKHPVLIITTSIFLVWVFGWIIGPYFIENIPIYSEIIQVAEERGIDTSAYMYEEKAGSYDGQYFLRDSFEHSGRDDYGTTVPFFIGMALCFIILGIGWRYIM